MLSRSKRKWYLLPLTAVILSGCTSAELAVDIKENGIILTGGGSLLEGLDLYIRNRTGLPVFISEDPLLAIVKGTGVVLDDIKQYMNDGILINV